MTSLGIDFGTTNSIVSYFAGGEPRLFVPRQSSGRPQIRSAIAWSEGKSKPLIGRAAFLKRSWRGTSLVDRFKLLIGQSDPDKQAAKAFLSEIMSLYQEESGSEAIKSIVLTVPDVWMQNEGQVSYQAMLDICSELSLPVRKILSEPVAAASYFAHLQSTNDTPFNGHVLIYDHGGGTLDMSLVFVEGTRITTVDSLGIAGETLGIGGLHFDRAVAEHMIAKDRASSAIISSDTEKWLDEFEDTKIEFSGEIEDILGAYMLAEQDSDFNDVAMIVGDVEIFADDLVTVFNGQFQDRIIASTEALIQRNTVSFDDADRFRVVLVGGFSSFCLVRWNLERKFNRKDCPGIFESGISQTDAPFAIAKGACLYSAHQTDVFETCPVGIDIRVLDAFGSARLLPLLKRGVALNKVEDVTFAETDIVAENRADLRRAPIRFVIRGSAGDIELSTDSAASQILPNFSTAHSWRIGSFVAPDLIAHVVFETNDTDRATNSFPLGDIVKLASAQERDSA